MDFAPPTDYRLIDNPAALEKFAQQLKSATCLAVDLEADSMFHFQERVCLIQIATVWSPGKLMLTCSLGPSIPPAAQVLSTLTVTVLLPATRTSLDRS